MSLKPKGQLEGLDLSFPKNETSERGGILSMVTVSGIDVLQYVVNPSGARPLGVQLNDIEYIDLTRQYFPTLRRTDQPMTTVGVGTQGDFETDWLYLVGVIRPGTPAYLGPSGTVTDDASLGGVCLGKFISPLRQTHHQVVYAGLGFTTSYMDPFTRQIVVENNPADRILIDTPGFATIRIDQSSITRSQALKGY